MSNEPVAWIEPDVIPLTHIIKAVVRREQDEQYSIPLYTHPVKEQLTEEQVIDITKAFFNIHPETQLSEKFSIPLYELTHFARAILRKASEK